METARGKHRVKVENEQIKRREKEFLHDQMWGGVTKYYDHFNQRNAKYENWTSPRYYTSSMKQFEELTTKQTKEDLLVKRRENLRKLYEDEASSFDIEMMVEKNKQFCQPTASKHDEVPYHVLKDINDTFKDAQEIRRKQEAEAKLYQQWRMNSPIVRNYERAYNNRNVKLSWLDQQIEKRMKRERDEEEDKKIIKEREETLKKQRELEEDQKKELHEKNRLYKTMLDEQVVELKQKQLEAEMLKQIEREESKKKMSVVEIEEKHTQEERRRLERECALYNIRQHKQKLKQKAVDIQENLAMENELILKLKNLEMERMMQDAKKRQQVKESFEKYANLVKMQQELEKDRQKQLDFVFDSEAKDIFERQTELWKNEEKCRQKLLKEVLATIKKQIEDNLEKNRERQRELQREKKENEVNIQEYNKELEKLDREKENKKHNRRVELDEDVKVKNARKFQQENIKLKELDDELDRIRKEEERLKKEILNIQKKHANVRPSTSRTRCFY